MELLSPAGMVGEGALSSCVLIYRLFLELSSEKLLPSSDVVRELGPSASPGPVRYASQPYPAGL